MDRVRKKRSRFKRWLLLPAVGLLCVMALLGYRQINKQYAGFNVERDSLIIGEVQYGSFNVSVRGPGVLLPLHERWVASRVAGRVDQLNIKPGTFVKPGETLIVMVNPQLTQRVDELNWELKAMEAKHLADRVLLESKLLDQETVILAAKMRYDKNALKLDAETELVTIGNSTVSRIDYQRSQLDVAQQQQAWQIEVRRLEKMRQNFEAQIHAAKANYQRLHQQHRRAVEDVEALTITASIDGVVQDIPVELGQRVSVGTNLALIGQQDQLYAQVNIAETQVRQVSLDQAVTVDTRNNLIKGKVSRIAPSVNDGIVKVDIMFTQPLPADARPDLSVDAKIAIEQIDQALFVRRPTYAKADQLNNVYKLSEDGKSAFRHDVYFGTGSLSQIQIKEGLNPGDQVILSDSTPWQSYAEINIY
ncbi:efflux RND transporter periplasmic adaptor subunit [Photobacterium alginatilyticum]|nr:HlyD family efflux transporter periplasmic adaptor subunit [Photobacterium alginatilyticum]